MPVDHPTKEGGLSYAVKDFALQGLSAAKRAELEVSSLPKAAGGQYLARKIGDANSCIWNFYKICMDFHGFAWILMDMHGYVLQL